MEPKVIEDNLLSVKSGFWVDKKFTIFKQEGSGNNWSYGYNFHGPSIRE